MVDTAYKEFLVSAGDTQHWGGVESVYDTLWMTNFELVYAHPNFMESGILYWATMNEVIRKRSSITLKFRDVK